MVIKGKDVGVACDTYGENTNAYRVLERKT
jgi:hypothetical protein